MNGQRNEGDDESSSVSPKMVLWRGNSVPEKEAKALQHVFDNLQDHFGHQRPDPKIRFSASLTQRRPGMMWSGDLEFTYNIDGDHCNLAYIGMDVCIDLSRKLVHKHGELMLKDYGKSWLYVYLPEFTLDKVIQYVKNGTGYDVSDEGTVYDPNRNLIAIEAKMHHGSGDPEPSFWVLKDKDIHRADMAFSRLGSVQEVIKDPEHQHMHRGVGIFSVSMEVEGYPNPNVKPAPVEGIEANLSFTLISARTWGVTDCVAPIVHAPSKWREYREQKFIK